MDWGRNSLFGAPFVDSDFFEVVNNRMCDQAQIDADRGLEWFVIEFNELRNQIMGESNGLG